MEKDKLLKKLHELASFLKAGTITLKDFDKLAMLEVYDIDINELEKILPKK